MIARYRVMRLSLLASLFIAIPSATALGDIVHLKDGTKVEGSLKKTDEGYDVVAPDGTITKISSGQVRSVELKSTITPDDAQRRLDSLRRSVAHLSDLKIIISRFKDFIAKHRDTPAAEEAKKDLAQWQSRLEQGMAKSGDQWVTPEELGAIQEQSLAAAIHARRLLKQGRLKEAGPILDEALKDDPKNASALYLRGVMLYRQDQLGPARKAFEDVSPLAPDHGPTLNNIAVILWRQNQHVAAMASYEAAMAAAPMEPVILNNVAEALNSIPEAHRSSQIVKKVIRHFNEQDDALAEAMAEDGRYRWGSGWVTGAELDKLEAKEKEIRNKIQIYEEQFEEAKAFLDQIEQDIADTQRSLRRMEADTYRRDASGRLLRRPLPRIYYNLRQDLEDLEQELADQELVIEKLRQDAKKVQQEMPVPRYTGMQRLIEVEGTPLIPRPEPAAAAVDLRRNPDAPRLPEKTPAPKAEPAPPRRPKEK